MWCFLFNRLRTRLVGGILKEFDAVGSTNDLAFEFAEKGEPEGTVVIAREQTRGKGRQGRTWHSRPGKGLYFSVILRPTFLSPQETGRLAIMLGVAVREVLAKYYGLPATLRWPNDILVGGRKLAGILVENKSSGWAVDFVVAGIGVNCGWTEADRAGDFRTPPTAVNLETGKPVDEEFLLERLLSSLDAWYGALKRGKWARIKAAAERGLAYRGAHVLVRAEGRETRGTLAGLGAAGELLVTDAAGNTAPVWSGEVEPC